MVLYQLRRGSLPFGDENTLLPRLIENVRTLDPVHNPLPLSATAGESKSGDRNGNIYFFFYLMLFARHELEVKTDSLLCHLIALTTQYSFFTYCFSSSSGDSRFGRFVAVAAGEEPRQQRKLVCLNCSKNQ